MLALALVLALSSVADAPETLDERYDPASPPIVGAANRANAANGALDVEDRRDAFTVALSSVLSGVAAGLGGASLPLLVGGGLLSTTTALQSATAPAGVAAPIVPRGEGGAVCCALPLAGVFSLVAVSLAALSLGATYGLAYAGALPAGQKAAHAAGILAVAGACGGCVAGWLGAFGWMCATSRTAGSVTTCGEMPYPYTLIGITTATAVGATAGATLSVALDAGRMFDAAAPGRTSVVDAPPDPAQAY